MWPVGPVTDKLYFNYCELFTNLLFEIILKLKIINAHIIQNKYSL